MPHPSFGEILVSVGNCRLRSFAARNPHPELRKSAKRQGYHVRSPLILTDFDQFGKFAAVGGPQLSDQLRLHAGLLANEQEDTELPPRCDLVGVKGLCLLVFDEI
jgi:hypothetical protein